MAFSAIRSSMAAKRSLHLYSLFRSPSIAGNRRWLSESSNPSPSTNDPTTSTSSSLVPVSYILASNKLEVGQTVTNSDSSQGSERSFLHSSDTTSTYQRFKDLLRMANIDQTEGETEQSDSSQKARAYDIVDLHSQVGNCLPLSDIPIGTFVHSIECRPGQGAKLVRAAGTCAKILKEPAELCLIRLPSGVEKLIDSRCRATIGAVSNPTHKARKLRKAGQSRWLGRRPVVRGVAMNPIDHPHGGGEGRASGGRPSVTPWGKPTKAGYKTVLRKSTKVRFT